MAVTNIAEGNVTSSSIEVRGYCEVSSSANIIHRAKFFCNGDYYASDYNTAGRMGYTTAYKTKSGLNSDTRYRFYIEFYNSAGTLIDTTSTLSAWTDESAPPPITRPNTPGTISYYDITTNSVDVSCSSVSRADGYNLYRNINGSASYINYRSNPSFYVTGLSPDTDYKYGISAENDGGESSISWGNTFTTDREAPTRPNNWSWEFTISSGGSFYQQGLETRSIYLMRAAHWNSFTSRINSFRGYKGVSSYSFTSASTSTTEVGIRNCINQAIDAINSMLPAYQRMNNIYSGDSVSASIFTNMRDKLNSIS